MGVLEFPWTMAANIKPTRTDRRIDRVVARNVNAPSESCAKIDAGCGRTCALRAGARLVGAGSLARCAAFGQRRSCLSFRTCNPRWCAGFRGDEPTGGSPPSNMGRQCGASSGPYRALGALDQRRHCWSIVWGRTEARAAANDRLQFVRAITANRQVVARRSEPVRAPLVRGCRRETT